MGKREQPADDGKGGRENRDREVERSEDADRKRDANDDDGRRRNNSTSPGEWEIRGVTGGDKLYLF